MIAERLTLPRRARSSAGVTLVEATIVLMAISILAAAAAPVTSRTIERAKLTRAFGDCAAIKTAVLAFFASTDLSSYTGFTNNGTTTGTTTVMLVSDGDTPREASLADDNGAIAGALMRWDDPVLLANNVDFLGRHLVTNAPIGGGSYPLTGAGTTWRGAYLSSPVDSDPWGNRYCVNTKWLRDNAVSPAARVNDVWAYSSGPDEEIDSLFEVNGGTPADDDIIVVIRRDSSTTPPLSVP